ncbi:hypothetical protein SAMN06265784_11852 [Paraburkholderia susongensis]|uniref:Uncharacterized protein n=1 Tax=Paraburkholderia susongensis TaxID=1515439 RepID=A0A1X7M460_9BURK|nr:hypothetical protein SAMN06265784_11852 [Paraburkholderia susongensis]
MRWDYPACIAIPRRDDVTGVFFYPEIPRVFLKPENPCGQQVLNDVRITPHKKKPGAKPGFKKDG